MSNNRLRPTGARLLMAIRRVMGGGTSVDRDYLLNRFKAMAERSPIANGGATEDGEIMLDFLEYLYKAELHRSRQAGK